MDKTQAQLDFNAAQCIQSASSFGHMTYTNICSGAVHVVQWGAVDWLGCIAAIGGCLALFAFVAFFLFMMVSDW